MRMTQALRSIGALLTAGLLLTGPGCTRHMPVSALGEQGGNIGVRVVTVTGEVVFGRLLALDGEEIVVLVTQRTTGRETERRFPMEEVASATVHKTKSESTWGPVISTVVAVAGGVLVASIVKGAGL